MSKVDVGLCGHGRFIGRREYQRLDDVCATLVGQAVSMDIDVS